MAEFDRGGVWVAPYDRYERVLLAQQAKFDRRYLAPTWYWRFLNLDDAHGAAPDEALWESPDITRRYADPIPVHIYVDDSKLKKGADKGTVETTGLVKLGWSRAEARRLGALLKTSDDSEGLMNDATRQDFLFVPRPGDLFLYRYDFIYRVQQMKREWASSTKLVTVWKGTATLARNDSTLALFMQLPAPPSKEPPLPTVVPWAGR